MKARGYGLVAEFETADALAAASRELHRRHFTKIEIYSPFPIHLPTDIRRRMNPLPAMVFVGGIGGAALAWAMQIYVTGVEYPLNVGGRPLYSWPSFVPILFELTVLCAALAAFFGSLMLSGFPRIHHPLFGVPGFKSAMRDRFFLCVTAEDPLYQVDKATEILEQFNPLEVTQVEAS